ncbi:unnamed protein product [Danaus chrysippus]|uniref:(African queen) hypothetical protein n=1 Tax=Danaus chrysippus TaxID=151541 RepID=A0A8J2W7W0_9NEOP|nr:unnamed protein product [Danaus chrysippus]
MFAKLIVILFYVQYVLLLTNCQEVAKFFRKDYDYIDSTKSFYKIHTIHRTWEDAKEMCDFEGSTLFYPYDEDEARAVINYWNQTQPFSWIFIGVSTPNAREVFETVDGLSISQVYDAWGPGEPSDAGGIEDCVVLRNDGILIDDQCTRKLPFICKKTLSTLEWNKLCDLPDMDESLRRSGYTKWGVGQPDGKGKETCGSMFFNGKLNDISCDQRCFFICEHEPPTLTTEYDFRFGRPN